MNEIQLTKLTLAKLSIDSYLINNTVSEETFTEINNSMVKEYGDDGQLLLEVQEYLKQKVTVTSPQLARDIESASKKSLYNLANEDRYTELSNSVKVVTEIYPIEKQSVGQWLYRDIIPNFFPMSTELYKSQAAVLAALLCLRITEQPKNKTTGYYALAVPMISVVGVQETGKSNLVQFASWFHPQPYRVAINGGDTGAHTRDKIYQLTKGDGRGLAYFDNVYFQGDKRTKSLFDLWDRFIPAFNAITQDVAFTGKASKLEENSEQENLTPVFIYKWFTSTQNPLLYETPAANKDFATRTLVIYRELINVDFIVSDFDWRLLEDLYIGIWSKNSYTRDNLHRYINTISYLKSPGRSKQIFLDYGLGGRRFDISILVIATGVYQQIWGSVDEAISAMVSFFEHIDNRKSGFESSSIYRAVEYFCDVWYPSRLSVGEYSPNAFEAKVFQVDFYTNEFNKGNIFSKMTYQEFEESVNYLKLKGWIYDRNPNLPSLGLMFVRKELLERMKR